MLGILGVPPVTKHATDAPYAPLAGGVADLVYRYWRDPDYGNGGDILPAEWEQGVSASDKQTEFGIGPGCTGEDGDGAFTGQAVPPVRVKEVCQALNVADDPATPGDESHIALGDGEPGHVFASTWALNATCAYAFTSAPAGA